VCVGEVAASDTRNAFSHLREQENSRLREKLCHHPELHHDICTLVRDLNLEVRSWVRADVVRVVRADTFQTMRDVAQGTKWQCLIQIEGELWHAVPSMFAHEPEAFVFLPTSATGSI